ncbi:cation:proton antiporter [Mesorhizobium sp. Z1-4]|uniref:cation:proton antiporter domain-containing protein n=1 Tax=Mesorhizobium sp. Z1-4 TaxID=2448478 RepID=UPI000FDC5BB8|nr:cation:proton antiporter [Mesorhizobium sp. Z1-4]
MTDFLLLAFIFLVAGVASVPIASRLGLGSVLGYLIAGIAISPILALLNVDVVSIQHFAEFGVVMMLFLVGLELEPEKLWQMRGRLIGLGGGQVAATTLVVMAVAMVLGETWSISLAIGLVLALSSTAIVLQTLNERGILSSDGGQASFSVLLFQDIAVIPMLALMPLLAAPELLGAAAEIAPHGAEASHAAEAGHGPGLSLVDGLNSWQTALVTIAAIGIVVAGGSYLTRPIFRFIAMAQLRELFTATALMMVVGIALLMSLVGLSPALGTFLAGVVLANSEYRHELESDIDPFRGLLLGLFFMTVGAGINFTLLGETLWLTIALTLGLMLAKCLVLLALAYFFKLRGADKWLFTLGLAQAGEFGFVLLSFTVANSILPQAIADQLLLVIALSMLLTPLLFIFYDRIIVPRYTSDETREADEIEEPSQIIIAGAGRVGGIVNRMLKSAGYTPTIIDFNSSHLEALRTFGVKVYYGDATRPDLLAAAGIADAKLFVIAIDNKEQINELVRYATATYPNLHVIARARNRHHVYELWAAGCRDIIRETYDGSLRMGRSAFQALGASKKAAERMKDLFNDTDREAMIAVADAYDPDIPAHENEAYVARIREVLETRQTELMVKMGKIREEEDAKREPAS